jgi:polysaccharide deacetylase family protein (PEP-CTERM system associated)
MVSNSTVRNSSVISVDVEDYFQVEAFSRVIKRDEWSQYPSRVEVNTRRLMDLFDESGVKATFFVLGWVADKHPQIVREIVSRGHEPACHSYWHRLIYNLSPDEFRRDTALAKDCIEQAAGRKIFGYRAPCFSITKRCLWALDILTELGFRYDSSIFPVRHDWYGIPEAPRKPFQIATPSGLLTEYPMATFSFSRTPNLPVGGGGYLRMLPSWYTRLGVRRAWREGITVITYVHPWEIDPEQPRVAASLKSRFRHYTNLEKTKRRLSDLLAMGSFSPFCRSNAGFDTPVWHFATDTEERVPAAADFDVPAPEIGVF